MRYAILCGLVVLNSSISAEKVSFYVNGGYSFPASPMGFAEYWGAGFNFGAGIGVLPTSIVSFYANFDYSEFGLKKEKYKMEHPDIPPEVYLQGGTTQIISGSIGIKASPLMPVPFRPYFTGEIGGIRKKRNAITYVWGGEKQTVEQGDWETVPSIVAFGLGVDFVYTRILNVFIEIGYRIGFTTVGGWTGYAPIKMGVKLNF